MKRLIGALFGIFVFFETVVALSAATYQPRSLGWVNFSYSTMTVAAINASTAPTIAYPVFCTDCVAGGAKGTICISTSTGAPGAGSDFVLSTGTICK